MSTAPMLKATSLEEPAPVEGGPPVKTFSGDDISYAPFETGPTVPSPFVGSPTASGASAAANAAADTDMPKLDLPAGGGGGEIEEPSGESNDEAQPLPRDSTAIIGTEDFLEGLANVEATDIDALAQMLIDEEEEEEAAAKEHQALASLGRKKSSAHMLKSHLSGLTLEPLGEEGSGERGAADVDDADWGLVMGEQDDETEKHHLEDKRLTSAMSLLSVFETPEPTPKATDVSIGISREISMGKEMRELVDEGTVVQVDDDYHSDEDESLSPRPSPGIGFGTQDAAEGEAAAAGGADKGGTTLPPLKPVASWVVSMSEYAMRRKGVEEKVEAGHVHAELSASKLNVVPVQWQVNLDAYTHESQAKRRACRKDATFVGLVKSLWLLVRDEPTDVMDKVNYVTMISKFHYIVCPPPVKREQVMLEAETDWVNDSVGKPTMSYERFFDAIFQLCDIWTHSCEVTEYCELLERLIGGATRTDSDGTLSWREDTAIDFDDFFVENSDVVAEKMHSDMVVEKDLADVLEQHAMTREEYDRAMEGNYHEVDSAKRSALGEYGGKKKAKVSKAKKQSRRRAPISYAARKDAILPPEKVMQTISRIYQSKLRADAWADDHRSVEVKRTQIGGRKRKVATQKNAACKKLRFDAFVLRYFQQLYGTKGIARRHLRNFVESIQVHATGYARIRMFAQMAGVAYGKAAEGGDSPAFNTRIVQFYFLPTLRMVFPDPKLIEQQMGNGLSETMMPRYQFLMAAVKMVAHKHLQGSRILGSFLKELRLYTVDGTPRLPSSEGSDTQAPVTDLAEIDHLLTPPKGKKSSMPKVDFDEGLLLVTRLWHHFDFMNALHRIQATRSLQQWYKMLKASGKLEPGYWEVAESGAEGGDAGVAAGGGLADGEGELSDPGGVVMSSPRKRIEDAKVLDAEVNA